MTDRHLCSLPLTVLATLIKRRDASPGEIVDSTLERIAVQNPRLNAYLTVLSEEARDCAVRAEAEIRDGKLRGPLHGIPFAVKDIFATEGIRTTAGSRIYQDWVPDHDARTVVRLKQAGAILVGKLNTSEFAGEPRNVNEHYGPARNPHDLQRISGGSSGGSAVAVAAGLTPLALGSDTGGSIRIPAALCGVVGLKPTLGLVSTDGVIPLSWTLDHVGPLTHTVGDAAMALDALVDRDRCGHASPHPGYFAAINSAVNGLRVGVPRDFFFDDIDIDVDTTVRRCVEQLADLGVDLIDVSTPWMVEVADLQRTISLAESAAYHEDHLRERASAYSADVRGRLQQGASIPAPAYIRAMRARAQMIEQMTQLFEYVDILVSPAVSIPAPRITETTIELGGTRCELVELLPRLTRPHNFLGIPALSLPCGLTTAGLPVGIQFAAKPFADDLLLALGHQCEQQLGITSAVGELEISDSSWVARPRN